jgi:hypothetical protein
MTTRPATPNWDEVQRCMAEVERRCKAYPRLVEALRFTLPLLLQSGHAWRNATALLLELGESERSSE